MNLVPIKPFFNRCRVNWTVKFEQEFIFSFIVADGADLNGIDGDGCLIDYPVKLDDVLPLLIDRRFWPFQLFFGGLEGSG